MDEPLNIIIEMAIRELYFRLNIVPFLYKIDN